MYSFIILASCEQHFIRVLENLVQHPSNNISILGSYMQTDGVMQKFWVVIALFFETLEIKVTPLISRLTFPIKTFTLKS